MIDRFDLLQGNTDPNGIMHSDGLFPVFRVTICSGLYTFLNITNDWKGNRDLLYFSNDSTGIQIFLFIFISSNLYILNSYYLIKELNSLVIKSM